MAANVGRAADFASRPLRSVRGRTTAAATAVVGVALAAAAFLLVELQERELTANVEDTIRLRADDIGFLLAEGSPPPSISVSDDEVSLVQVLDADGRVVTASPNIAGQSPVIGARPGPGESVIVRVRELPIEDDGFLVLARGIETSSGRYTIFVAGSLETVEESAETLTRLLRLGLPAVLALVAASTWLLVGRTLAPVESIRREVAAIGNRELARRVPEPPSHDEVGRLARTMNAMLERLESASEKQDRFVADAAHELRSPLATMRAEIEVELNGARDPSAEHTLRGLHEEVIRMQRLVDDLLLLARGDAGTLAEHRAPVDLDDVVLAECRRARLQADVELSTGAVSAGAVRGDAEQLARAVRNLLDNAIHHARSHVGLSLAEREGVVTLTVTDDGPGFSADGAERAFERFSRLDAGRGRSEGGAGLGLAITRAIVAAHGGAVVVDPSYRQGARLVVTLPSAG